MNLMPVLQVYMKNLGNIETMLSWSTSVKNYALLIIKKCRVFPFMLKNECFCLLFQTHCYASINLIMLKNSLV